MAKLQILKGRPGLFLEREFGMYCPRYLIRGLVNCATNETELYHCFASVVSMYYSFCDLKFIVLQTKNLQCETAELKFKKFDSSSHGSGMQSDCIMIH